MCQCCNLLCAGFNRHIQKYTNAVETYNPESDLWTIISPLNVARKAAGVCISGGKIYILGGLVEHFWQFSN